jgi:hypothetical protein
LSDSAFVAEQGAVRKIRGKWSKIGLVVVASALVPTASAWADGSPAGSPASGSYISTAYVSPTGSGTSCSAAQPCGSLQVAMTRVGDGATVVLAAGSYPAQALGRQMRSAAFQKPVTITPAPGASVTVANLWISAPNVVVQNLVVAPGEVLIDRNDVTLDGIVSRSTVGRPESTSSRGSWSRAPPRM